MIENTGLSVLDGHEEMDDWLFIDGIILYYTIPSTLDIPGY